MSYDIKAIFGKNLRREREKRNLSQEKFAELIDIGIPALSKLECGKSYPKTQTLQKIIDVFKISPHVLYVTDDDFDVNTAYDDMLSRLKTIKQNKEIFKLVYERFMEIPYLYKD